MSHADVLRTLAAIKVCENNYWPRRIKEAHVGHHHACNELTLFVRWGDERWHRHLVLGQIVGHGVGYTAEEMHLFMESSHREFIHLPEVFNV